ncbi:MAG: LON peptidase substrate-binding domain-containing protein [Verrucomicrobia bacterium]|nr:LON peptidase substrate-binding domain-containing protein [Verrucomicrobiota bacterium]
MQLPATVPVMTLPNATLFPGALLPLYIFEPRYRRMLDDALESQRMFAVAMRKPGCRREIPSAVAGLGLIRVSVAKRDGTSYVILQGLSRVQLETAVRYKPYRVQRIAPLAEVNADSVVVDALAAKVRDLVSERFDQGVTWPAHVLQEVKAAVGTPATEALPTCSLKHFLSYLERIEDPGQVADLISCTLLSGYRERQIILETVDLESRLRFLIHFLMGEIRRHRKERIP